MVKNFPGTLFLIVGNSSSGKDSVISGVVRKYPLNLKKIYYTKRYITRKSSEHEENYYISPNEFLKMSNKGEFTLKWHIYGLDYGISIEIEDWLKNGHPVLVNVSRTIIKETKLKYQKVKVISIEVPFEITLQRIKKRGRESEKYLKMRIERAQTHQIFPEADFRVDNSGKLDEAVNQFLNYLIKVVKKKK